MQHIDGKRLAAEKAVEFIEDGMVVALGTGSTAYWAIQRIGERLRQGLRIEAIASSIQSEQLAHSLNIPIIALSRLEQIDVAIDGADEVDGKHNLIKGGGGALLREKILASNSEKFIVIVDESKMVATLGQFPLPVEVASFAVNMTLKQLERLGAKVKIRQKETENFITDNGNLIIDCQFNQISIPEDLEIQIKSIPGVLETGLFLNKMVTSLIVGYRSGLVKVM